MGGISLDTAVLIAMVVEAMLYGMCIYSEGHCTYLDSTKMAGVFLVMFFFSLWVFVYRRTLSVLNRLLVTSVLLFIVATIVSSFPILKSCSY